MPIEINELHIKVSVDASAGAGNAGAAAGDSSSRSAIVAECVELVLQTLRDQRER